jgi:SPP1 family predicted phage head-tail adaptor
VSLAFCRIQAERDMTQTAQLLSPTSTRDPVGGPIVVWEEEGEPLPCRVMSETTPAETQAADRATAVTLWEIKFPHDTIIEDDWRVQVDDAVFEVTGDNAEHADRIALTVTCKKVG